MPPVGDANAQALRISVVNGNLKFVRQALLLGHYRSLTLTGTEHAIDPLIGGGMTALLRTGQYPDAPGSASVFINAHQSEDNPLQRKPRPQGVIVVGLGDEGNLRPADLILAVRTGIVAWAQRLSEPPARESAPFELVATLIGSGGPGISPGQSACLVVQGALDARKRLTTAGLPVVGHVQLIELYLDRATEAWRALRTMLAADPGLFALDDVISAGVGPLPRPLDEGYRGAPYDMISAVSRKIGKQTEVTYSLDTRRARTEVRAQPTQLAVIREQVAEASADYADMAVGRTLFRLLVPADVQPFLESATEALIEVDSGTAGIPWEMLDSAIDGDTDAGDAIPWAIRAKLLRKLRTDSPPRLGRAPTADSVLVVGEPDSPEDYNRLPNAREEAQAVTALLKKAGIKRENTETLISNSPAEKGMSAKVIVQTLLSRPWRIVHIAGHGEYEKGKLRGVVLSGGRYLSAAEFQSLQTIPDLVFVNCCYLAKEDEEQLLAGKSTADKGALAASVADALIKIGVRCVIAAGWALRDDAAKAFGTTFYKQIFDGVRFMDAVAAARSAARALGGNTWAAYQCYGDPDWTWTRRTDDAYRVVPPHELFASVGSAAGLVLALQTLTVKGVFDGKEQKAARDRIEYLEEHFAPRWGENGNVAEAFAAAWAGPDMTRAIAWYERAIAADDGRASIKAVEQLGNLRVKRAWNALAESLASGTADDTQRHGAIEQARNDITSALTQLEQVVSIQPTMERVSLCASAWKRIAQLEAAAGNEAGELEALTRMRDGYAQAEELARRTGNASAFYPAMNVMAAELVVDAQRADWPGFAPARLAAVRQWLGSKSDADPDFWSEVGLIELDVYEAVAKGDLASIERSVGQRFQSLYARVTSRGEWSAVKEQQQFILSKYRGRALPREQEACARILESLDGILVRGGFSTLDLKPPRAAVKDPGVSLQSSDRDRPASL